MFRSQRPRVLSLSRGWPRRVRSAVIQVISLARTSLALTRSWASNSMNPQLRLQAETDRLQQEIFLLRKESRIKDASMAQIDAQKRPDYPPIERLAILELRAACGWTLAQTARAFLVTPPTIASWMGRLDEEGPDALVRLPEPVNRFPDFVGYLVKRLKVLCSTMGRVRISQILARAGLHLGPTTVRRMLSDARWPTPRRTSNGAPHIVTAWFGGCCGRGDSSRNPAHRLDKRAPTALGERCSIIMIPEDSGLRVSGSPG